MAAARAPIGERPGETTWFNWTRYPDHGPGAELLEAEPGGRVLDLGCGKGGNISHLTVLGMRAVGVDASAVQRSVARGRWGRRRDSSCTWRTVGFLQGAEEPFDAVYSVYAAVWFPDPARLLPAVRERLRPGGRLVFSQRARPGR
ncbi:class I SAM-dependent methyltransferase [Streptomyces sp. NPDC002758]